MGGNQHATFIGLDLAWNVESKHSGIAVLRGDDRQVNLEAVSEDVRSLADVVEFIVGHATVTTVVAVDASLVVKNAAGQRPCEALIGRTFGKYGASCHSTNLAKPYAQSGMNVVTALGARGFVHDFNLDAAKQRPGRWLFEVYPHPAMVRLFKLTRILRYKKGSVSEKRAGLRTLQGHLRGLIGGEWGLKSNALLESWLTRDPDDLQGQGLKRLEDSLDAVFCAYLAWHCWRWGEEKNEMFGTLKEGYIVVPTVPAD